jgi:raffinose/stachyose/melibiose transport system permease protein
LKTNPKNIKIHIILIVLGSIIAIPIIIVVLSSFRGTDPQCIAAHGEGSLRAFLCGVRQNYGTPLSEPFFLRGFLNSLIITIPSVLIVLFIASLTGFALSKLNLPGKGIIFPILLLGLMLPVSAIIVQIFLTLIRLRLLNNYLAVILPVVSLTMPFGLLVIKNYMDDIPNDIVEASIIDGCTPLTIYSRVILPLTLPALAAVTIFAFLNAWNEFLLPLVALRKTELFPVTKIPTYYMGRFMRNYPMFFASFVIITLPVVAMYVFLQKYFIKGLTAGAIK